MAAAVIDIKFDHILEKLLTKTVKTGKNQCFLWSGVTKNNGTGTVYGISRNPFHKLGGNRPKFVTIHRLVYMCKNKITAVPSNDVDQGDISHLCHQPLCINPAHLVLEAHSVNNGRQFCQRTMICNKSHDPHCIL